MIEDYFFDLGTLAPKFQLNNESLWIQAFNAHPLQDKQKLAKIIISYIDLIYSIETFPRYDWGWLRSFLLKHYIYTKH